MGSSVPGRQRAFALPTARRTPGQNSARFPHRGARGGEGLSPPDTRPDPISDVFSNPRHHFPRDPSVIGRLKGTVDSFGPDSVILDVHGVGYVVHCSARTLLSLPGPGEAAVLSIETHVRETEI